MSKKHYEDMARRFGLLLREVDKDVGDSLYRARVVGIWGAIYEYSDHCAAYNENFDRYRFEQAVSDWRTGAKS